MKIIKNIMIIIVIALVLVACGSEQPSSKEGVLNISVLQFTAHSALDDVYTGFLEGLEEAGLKVETDYVIDYYNAQGDAATTETIANTIVNSKPDLIFAIATPAAQALANKTDTIPIIVAAVTDPVSAGLVIDNEKPETNVSGVSDLTPVKRQIELMKEVAPNVKTVGIMYANSEDNSRFQADIAKAEIEALGMEWIDASVSESNQIQQMTESIVTKVDAIYIPTDNLLADNYSIVTKLAIERKLVTVSGESEMVKVGGLITDGINYINSGKLAGAMANDVLINELDISEIPIKFLANEDLELVINTKTAEAIGIEISEELIKNASLIVEE